MSDYETGDTGDTGADYGHYSAGQESTELDQLHQAQGSEQDAQSQFGVYENDHHAQESTDFSTGQHVEYDQPAAVHFESDNYTNYSHDASEDDHVFAAEGSESSHSAEFSELDALEQRFDAAFAEGTQFHQDGIPGGGAAELGPADK
ncbi:hypothetical protein [Dactylosporangium sp. CS-033363]|uniref:hypothetical protein n=1 Tax=Dactylosporangium sp. CS-033363 TaxID=3239935 RepID=UPI003D94DCCC